MGRRGELHRKVWEFAYIAQALEERGMLRAGRRGLGFGVGQEPLTALFAGMGCDILATDQAIETASLGGWTRTGQHAASLDVLASGRGGLCAEAEFYERVSFRVVDMRHIPLDLGLYDFVWSACALEHLGSLEAGIQFVRDSLRFVAPGGAAVHTTEYNVRSNEATLAKGGVVLYRRRDLEELSRGLVQDGHKIEIDFSEGNLDADRFVDRAPYFTSGKHLKLELGGHVFTSFGLIIDKGER